MRRMGFTGAILAVALLAAPARAQFSKSYNFLKAVRDADGQQVTDDLAQPGTTIVNTRDSTTGETALMIVTTQRDLTWMSFLIGKGADINLRDNHGASALTTAAALGFGEGVQLLLDHGARADEPNDTGETPLIAAVHRHDIAMIRVLLAGGADPDRTDNSGRSAREYAALMGKGNAILAVLDEGTTRKAAHRTTYGPTQ